jgi:hypothetical protein
MRDARRGGSREHRYAMGSGLERDPSIAQRNRVRSIHSSGVM